MFPSATLRDIMIYLYGHNGITEKIEKETFSKIYVRGSRVMRMTDVLIVSFFFPRDTVLVYCRP